MLVLMTGLVVGLLPGRVLSADPDFGHFRSLMQQTLGSSGPGTFAGDRSELYRTTDSGWEIRMMTLWDGEDWQLLAVRLHHPDRIPTGEGQWQERFDELVAGLDRDALPERPLPELVEVPPPTFLPAFPEEQRSRTFTFKGHWYEARWVNIGGLDFNAEWALRSYELIALP